MKSRDIQLVFLFVSSLFSPSAFAQCDRGAAARIDVDRIEAKPIPSVVANSSTGRRFVLTSESNQIDIVISGSSAPALRDFTSRYSKCTVIVSINGISLESELVSNLFPSSGEGGFTKYLGLTIPKTDHSLEHLEQISNGEKVILLTIK